MGLRGLNHLDAAAERHNLVNISMNSPSAMFGNTTRIKSERPADARRYLRWPTAERLPARAEEIEHFRRPGKPESLYFSEADTPHNHDTEQSRLLKESSESLRSDSSYL